MLKGNERQATPAVISELQLLNSHIADMLMRHDCICFGIYGENLLIAVLLRIAQDAQPGARSAGQGRRSRLAERAHPWTRVSTPGRWPTDGPPTSPNSRGSS